MVSLMYEPLMHEPLMYELGKPLRQALNFTKPDFAKRRHRYHRPRTSSDFMTLIILNKRTFSFIALSAESCPPAYPSLASTRSHPRNARFYHRSRGVKYTYGITALKVLRRKKRNLRYKGKNLTKIGY
jgi:hypothetical protein